jgi:hypothetical protein
MATTTTTSGQFNLNWADFAKGLIMAVLTPVVAIIVQSLNNGSLTFDWKVIGIAAASGGLAYIVKNLFTPIQIVIQDPSETDVKAVKRGAAKAVVVNKAL